MAGNSQRRGAMRNDGSKKGATVGSGGQRRKQLKGKGPTPKAVERPHHPAGRKERASVRIQDTAKKTARPSSGRTRDTADLLIGRNSVVEALRAKVPAKALYVQIKMDADDRLREALRLAVAQNVPMFEISRTDLDVMTHDAVHQGLVLTMPPYDYADLASVSGGTLLVALDGVTDPRNLGAVARSAAAFGADGIVIPTRRAAGISAGAWKTSAGALARVPVAQVPNLTRALQALQKKGFTVIGLAADGATSLAGLPADTLTDRVVIVIGAEGEGISRLVGETCDWLARIDMSSDTESLNASVAAGIALHAVYAARV